VAGLQVSVVQGLLSLQVSAAPPAHTPAEHASLVVQAFPSLHGATLLVCVQPVTGLQASSVQTLASSQFGAAPPTQAPAEQVSPVVQALPSSQGAMLFVWTQPVAGLHASSVHTFASSQFGAAPPTHTPAEQVSLVVQALPSLHGAVLLVKTHPVAGAQVSSVHGLLSLHTSAAPPTQAPAEQVSLVVQVLPSLQGAVLLVKTHPVPGAQVSSVHGLVSLHTNAAPPTQTPPEQVSFVVQAFPSLHGAVLLVNRQTPCTHASSVHTLESSHSSGHT
jgi:hypothetical protein